MPPQTVQRYLVEKRTAKYTVWRFNQKSTSVPSGFTLRIELLCPANITWTSDAWTSQQTEPATMTRLGLYFLDIPTSGISAGTGLQFTFQWPNSQWEGTNFKVDVV
jgi:glucoamylase